MAPTPGDGGAEGGGAAWGRAGMTGMGGGVTEGRRASAVGGKGRAVAGAARGAAAAIGIMPAGGDDAGRVAKACLRISFAWAVPSAPQEGQFTCIGMRPWTGSTSNLYLVPQLQVTLISIALVRVHPTDSTTGGDRE